MTESRKHSAFFRYALITVAYNVLVILWGVFLRASKSGDGCGQHWLTCHGEIIPSAPELKTVIEFIHRATSGVAFLLVLLMLIWAFRKFEIGSVIRKTAVVSFIFIVTEALIGAGLVLTGNTAESITPWRPLWAMGHLINSFTLLAFLALTAWFAHEVKDDSQSFYWPEPKFFILLLLGAFGIIIVGLSGSLAALSSMLFPSESLAEGLAKDFSTSSAILVRLRISHPILSILTSVYLLFLAAWLKKKGDKRVGFWSNVLSISILAQVAFGAATLLTLAPIMMQVGHLLLADAVWVTFIILSAAFMAGKRV